MEKIFQILDQGLEAARKQITATVMVDFPFCDCHGRGCAPGACALPAEEAHLAFDKADGLLERGWVFEVDGLGDEARLMLHGHTFAKWSSRGAAEAQNRADELTSVNWRIASKNARGEWHQDPFGNALLPAQHVAWRRSFRSGDYDKVVWKWRDWNGSLEGWKASKCRVCYGAAECPTSDSSTSE